MTDLNQDAWRDANRHHALDQDQVTNLPVGTKVVITWSGGNGPHLYEIDEQSEWGTWVRVPDLKRGRVRDPVTFVGSERYHTHVVLAENNHYPAKEKP